MEEIDSCHTRRLRRLDISGMDPSMLIGFLITDEADWKKWRKGVREVLGKPIIHVHDSADAGANNSVITERESAIDEVETFDTEEEGEL